MKTKQPAFKRGDTVTWVSQASGFKKRKTGKIVEVVKSCFIPRNKPTGYGNVRYGRSYFVNVNGKLYWPLVKYLKLKS